MKDEKERAIKILNSYKQHTRDGSLELVFDLAISSIQRNEAGIAECKSKIQVLTKQIESRVGTAPMEYQITKHLIEEYQKMLVILEGV